MTVKIDNESITVTNGTKLLDFMIDTSGIGLFTTNCKVSENKQSTYNIGNCTTVNCTTINCTTVNCTTIQCTTIQCSGYDNQCQCNCRCDCTSDS